MDNTSDLHSKKEHLQEKAREAKEFVGQKARETGERVKVEGESLLRDQKGRVASRIENYGRAVHKAAHRLEEEHDDTIASYAHRAADQLDRAAGYLRERDFSGLRTDAEQFARNHQELFFGGMFVAGLALARFLKAAPEPVRESTDSEPSSFAGGSPYAEPAVDNPVTPAAPDNPVTPAAPQPMEPLKPYSHQGI